MAIESRAPEGVDPRDVVVERVAPTYSTQPPFDPSERFPEYPANGGLSTQPNSVYAGVRSMLHRLGYDAAAYGTGRWNPLGVLVRPGDTVLLKPNLIRHSHAERESEWEQVVTHGALVRAVLDYVFIALEGRGRVVIADGPQTDSDFDAIVARNGLREVVDHFAARGQHVTLQDLRRDRWFQKGDVIYDRQPLPGDPLGYTTVELGESSEFRSYRLNGNFYGADYDTATTRQFHSNGRHAYILCRSVMDADVVINLPKLKTHKKTGVTLSLKNLVGINGFRNCLPHHTLGTPDEGGDEFPSRAVSAKVQSRLTSVFKRVLVRRGGRGGAWARVLKSAGKRVFGDNSTVVRSGNWYGNDTCWRMVLDLNKSLFHFNGEGRERTRPLRYFTIVDGVVAGDGNGPVAPEARRVGLLIGGSSPVSVDTVCTVIMGFDWRRVPVIAHSWEIEKFPVAGCAPEDVRSLSNVPEWSGPIASLERAPHLGFVPHFGWKGAIERDPTPMVAAG